MGGDTQLVVAPGLPNIAGTCGAASGNFSGAFYENPKTQWYPASGSWYPKTTSFDATRSNAIYGASNTVQPPAFALIPQIKY